MLAKHTVAKNGILTRKCISFAKSRIVITISVTNNDDDCVSCNLVPIGLAFINTEKQVVPKKCIKGKPRIDCIWSRWFWYSSNSTKIKAEPTENKATWSTTIR